MRVGIDARFYGLESTGLGRYTQELIHHVADAAPDLEFTALLRPGSIERFRSHDRNVELRVADVPHFSLREQLQLGRHLRAARVDLMHFTHFNVPLAWRAPFVVTVHDLTPLHFAGRRGRMARLPARAVIGSAVRRARLVLTPSAHQRQLLVEHLGTDPAKVRVTHEAVYERFCPPDAAEVERFRTTHGLAGPVVLYAGRWREHRNVVRLIEAFRVVRDAGPATLVLLGKPDPAFSAVPEAIERLGLAGDVLLTGFVDDYELPLYYAAADVFAFPSLAEGFGLPPLEAMACGTAVAASTAPPMPEVLGEAPEWFDPLDVDDMARAILKLLRDPDLRERRSRLGRERAASFSWHDTALATLAAYREALP